MFLPGSPCTCCGGGEPPCQPCQFCAPPCLTVTFDGFAHGTGNCGECDFLDDATFELKRPPSPQLSVTASVPSATGSGATFSVTTTRNATDGSYVVSGIKLLTGGVNYSLGDAVQFSTNGCFAVTPEASITIATTQPLSTNLRMASPSSAISPYTNAPGNISVTYSEQTDGEGNKFWTVSKLGAIGGGFGYAENQTVTLTPGWLISNQSYVDAEPGVVVQAAATARVLTTQRIMPLIQGRIVKAVGEDVTFQSGQYGLITLSEGTDANGRAVWSIASISTGWWFPSDFTSGDTVQITVPSGVTTVQPASVTLTVNGSGAVTAFNIVNGGVYYTTSGRPETVELLTGGAYYKPGVITSVTLTNGGKVWGPQVQESGLPACVYESDDVCAVCPSESGSTLFARIQLGATSHTFRLVRRTPQNAGTLILEATRPALDDEGNRIPCDSLTFEPEHFSEQYSCVTNGTVTVSQGTCGNSSSSGCDLPDQITLSASGIPLVMGHGSSYGFGSSEGWARDFADHCGISPYCLISESTGGGGNSWRASLVSRDESSIVLDRDQNPGECGISYSGAMPSLPSISRSFNNPYPFGEEDCGGALESRVVSVTISPVAAETSVLVSAPTWGQFGATAEATVSGGAVASIAVTNGGEGYAREVFARAEPTMTVTLSGGSGSGVVLSATLTQVGDGEEAYWYVSAVAVTNGGTGYSGQESVLFTPEEGTTTDYPASAVVSVGRIEPTLTASASPGSGADLSITLSEGVDWFTGQAYWYVESVAVDDGGTGYVDGDNVTFTVTDGVQSWPASATIATGRTQPDVTAEVVFSSGSGAALTPSLSASGNAWAVSGLTINSAGTGYSQWDGISFATDDMTEAGGSAYVTSVDSNGAITGVAINYGGSYYRSTGVIQSVTVSSGGSYYKSTGVVEAITLWEGGAYYKEESTGTSEVDTPQVTISSNVGEGAAAAAVIDGTLGSPTFGQITAINVTNGGTGYGSGGSRWRATIQYNGEIFHAGVADRVSANPCPSDLLSKSYAMSFSVRSIPGAFDDGCGEPDSATVDAIYSSITHYRWDGITVSLSPA